MTTQQFNHLFQPQTWPNNFSFTSELSFPHRYSLKKSNREFVFSPSGTVNANIKDMKRHVNNTLIAMETMTRQIEFVQEQAKVVRALDCRCFLCVGLCIRADR
jgi:hypothetical protein